MTVVPAPWRPVLAMCVMMALSGCGSKVTVPDTPQGGVAWPATWPRQDCGVEADARPADNVHYRRESKGTPEAVAGRFADAMGVARGEAQSEGGSTAARWRFGGGTLRAYLEKEGAVRISFQDLNGPWLGNTTTEAASRIKGFLDDFGLGGQGLNVTARVSDLYGLSVDVRQELGFESHSVAGFRQDRFHKATSGSLEPLYDLAEVGPLLEPWQAMCRGMAHELERRGEDSLRQYPNFNYGKVEVTESKDGITLTYAITRQWGESTPATCMPGGGCVHGCPAPGSLIKVDAETGAIVESTWLNVCM